MFYDEGQQSTSDIYSRHKTTSVLGNFASAKEDKYYIKRKKQLKMLVLLYLK